MRTFLLGLILLLAFPFSAMAHGGVSKVAGNVIVTLNQSPLSPLVGEHVVFSFKLTDLSGKALPEMPVKLALIDTFFNDATQDKVIQQEEFKTDVNGAFEFGHTFDEENYFDIDLSFDHPTTSEEEQTGFLIQPRDGPKAGNKWKTMSYVQTGLALVLLAIIVFSQRKEKV